MIEKKSKDVWGGGESSVVKKTNLMLTLYHSQCDNVIKIKSSC